MGEKEILFFRNSNKLETKILIEEINHIIHSINIDTDIELEEWNEKLHFILLSDFLSKDDYDKIALDAFGIVDSWYYFENVDLTKFNEISFGHYLKYELKRIYNNICKYIYFLNLYKPNKIYIVDDDSLIFHVVRSYAFANKIDIQIQKGKIYTKKYDWTVANPFQININLKQFFANTIFYIFDFFKKIGIKKATPFISIEVCDSTKSFVEYALNNSQFSILANRIDINYLFNKKYIVERNITESIFFLKLQYNKLKKSFIVLDKNSKNTVYHGVNTLNLIFSIYKNQFYYAFAEFYITITGFSRLVKNHNISALIVMQDQCSVPAAKVLVAKKNKIKTFMYQHGVPGFVNTTGLIKLNIDYFLTFGIGASERLRSAFGKIETIEIGADSYYNFGVTTERLNKLEIKNKYNLSSKNYILITIEPYSNISIDENLQNPNLILKDYCFLANSLPECNFIFRFHPSTDFYESIKIKENIVEKYSYKNNIYIFPKMSLSESLSISELVVATSSTVALQALTANRPLIIFDPLKEDAANYIFNEAGDFCYSLFELESKILLILNDFNYKKYILKKGKEFLNTQIFNYGFNNSNHLILQNILTLNK